MPVVHVCADILCAFQTALFEVNAKESRLLAESRRIAF